MTIVDKVDYDLISEKEIKTKKLKNIKASALYTFSIIWLFKYQKDKKFLIFYINL